MSTTTTSNSSQYRFGYQNNTTSTTKNPKDYTPGEITEYKIDDIADPNSINMKLMRFLDNRVGERIINTFNLSLPLYKNGLMLALGMQNEKQAELMLDGLMLRLEDLNGKDNKETFLHDLGLIAGYFDIEVRMRVERVFNCEHPWFGKAVDKPEWINEELRLKAIDIEQQWGVVDKRIMADSKKQLEMMTTHHSNKVRRRAVKLMNKYFQ